MNIDIIGCRGRGMTMKSARVYLGTGVVVVVYLGALGLLPSSRNQTRTVPLRSGRRRT